LIIVSNSQKDICGIYKSGAPGLLPKDLTAKVDSVLNLDVELCAVLQKQISLSI